MAIGSLVGFLSRVPKVNVSASTDIAVSASRAREALIDFKTWPVWSPWLYIEPETEVTYRGEAGKAGHGYSWVGEKTGEGNMTLLHSSDRRIDCDLQFIKPFKSEAEVTFDIDAIDSDNCRVTWHMKSSLPFFMFWMKGTMVGMIQSDYKRGLALLKDYLETGSIRSATTIDDIVDLEQVYYIGARGDATLDEIGPAMEKSFKSLLDASTSNQLSVEDVPMCFYNSMDIKTHRCEYTAALSTSEAVQVNAPLVSDFRPECSALKVIHAGPYRHLGNAWSVIMAEAKARKLKLLKSQVPFERYLNDPDEVNEDDLITEIYLPIKRM